MPAVVVGRETELALLRDFVANISGGAHPRLEGEAGTGKTTLWRVCIESAETDSVRVRAQPAESESSPRFAGLGDLLGPVLDEALDGVRGLRLLLQGLPPEA